MDRARFERLLVQQTTRRRLLAGGAAVTGLAVTASFRGRPTRSAFVQTTPDGFPIASPPATPLASPVASPVAATFAGYPFTLGVASGDPHPTGVVLWTRLAPSPLEDDGLGGMTGQPLIEVAWEVSTDEAFTNGNIVQRGTAVASPDLAYSVHADVTGLEPAREYYYRFLAGGETSPVGRTRTAPMAGAAVERLRFAFASCSMWEHGYFNAYRDIAESDLDLVFHLGDYFYEYEATGYAIPEGPVRTVTGPETVNLLDYRNRHALYKTDPNLQAAHAAFPWAVTWDDHEVDNNWTGAQDQDGTDPALFLPRRAEAFRAYYEHMPLRLEQMPVGPDMLLYRRLTWGDLAEFNVLDTRQYRTDHPCGDGVQVACPAGRDPEATLLGPEQERWLLDGLDASRATWNVLAQQIMAAAPDRQAGEGQKFGMDSWNGYPAARDRIFGHLLAYEIPNPVVITGDVHAYWVNDLKANFFDPDSATVGVEFVGTSISSNGDEDPTADPQRELLAESPFVKFLEGGRRGYVRCDVTPTLWRADLQAVENVHDPEAGMETLAAFVTQAGNPGIEPA